MPTHNGPGDPYTRTPPQPATPLAQDSAGKEQAPESAGASHAEIGKEYSNANA